MRNASLFPLVVVTATGFAAPASATLIEVTGCTMTATCTITPDPATELPLVGGVPTVTQDPNDGVLLLWDERQNITLTEALAVDRVFDPSAPFVSQSGSTFFLEVGTVVSSHYVQWDPSATSGSTVSATITADSQIFAFITDTQKLFDTDELFGLAGLDYNDFGLRGLESGDATSFNGESVDISWTASSPGDWARLITAFSPAAEVPAPAAAPLLVAGLAGFGLLRRRRKG